jgi:HEAT repeats
VSPHKIARIAVLTAVLGLGTSTATEPVAAASPSGIEQLTEELRSEDFRVQVQAALILGKSGDGRALQALTASLKDKSVAVRAASAAALGTLGDPAALPALRRAEEDSNSAVARRITATIDSLENAQREQLVARRNAKILIKIEGFDDRTPGSSNEALGAVAQASRKALAGMTHVALLNASEDPQQASKRHHRPVVVMRASLRQLSASKDGDDTVISANIEFLVERFPEQSIMGRLSGNASAKSTVDSAQGRSQLQEEAVGAAVQSALGRSESALLAAAGNG